MKILLKVGSNSVHKNGTHNIDKIVSDISKIKNAGHDVILVSSGAVKFGLEKIGGALMLDKHMVEPKKDVGIVKSKRKKILASLGQPYMMRHYCEILEKVNIHPAQILVHREDLSKSGLKKIRHLLKDLQKYNNFLPIINENDVLTNKHNAFIDNDQLAYIIAKEMDVDLCIFLTNVDGLIDKYGTLEQNLIRNVSLKENKISVTKCKSAEGRGGMLNKYNICLKLLKKNIRSAIANVDSEHAILKIINNEDIDCTKFHVLPKK